jgi:hypothetical protein
MTDKTELERVSQLTVVDHTTGGEGRVFERWNIAVRLDVQDDGRTLKVFVIDAEATP